MSAPNGSAESFARAIWQPGESGRRMHVFAYDVSAARRRRAMHRALSRWRVDGQYSLAEALLTPSEAREIAIELMTIADEGEDRVLSARLDLSVSGGVFQPAGRAIAALHGSPRGQSDSTPGSGCHIIAYDVRDPGRLGRVHRLMARGCAHLQESVYLFDGGARELARLVAGALLELKRREDDLRLYPVRHPADVWFLCGPAVTVVGGPPKRQWAL